MAGLDAKAAGKAVGEYVENVLSSNNPINKIWSSLSGPNNTGITGFVNRLSTEDAGDALKAAFSKGGVKENALNWGGIATSYIGASAAYRLASGGGLYKDNQGNTNLIGIPFV